MLETLNLVGLMIFTATWVLNFIFVGWYGAYAVILIYSLFYTLISGIFVIGRHQQRYCGFQKFKHLMLTTYITQCVAWVLSLAFLIVGIVFMNKYPNMDPYTEQDDYYKYRNGKWMIVLSIFFALYTPTFTAFIKEYNIVHIENNEEAKADDDNASANSEEDQA